MARKQSILGRAMDNFGRWWPAYIIGTLVGTSAINYQIAQADKKAEIYKMHDEEYKVGVQIYDLVNVPDDKKRMAVIKDILRHVGYEGPVTQSTGIEVYNPDLVRGFDFKPLYNYDGVERRGNTVFIPQEKAQEYLEDRLVE